ncbi:MAG: AAA family ATPase, partial [Candidatus Saganbacteria bacterium]|nr:AAA family ATPase [Candidatus Saganbacteria bacterium]
GDPTKPIFAGLFAGPTGVGKTETAKALARLVFNREDAIVVINGGEFQQEHELTKLKGAPPSYVGYGDRTQLDEVLEKNGRCVILIDEFEKMHKVIQEFLLAALDEGEVKNSKGQKVNFRESIIILTSNLGSDKLVKIPMDSAEDDFRELLAFRRETLEMIERLAEGFEARSYELQNEKRFDEAELLTQKGTALRRFLAENGSALQRGKFPEEPVDVSSNGHKTNIEELDKLLAERKLEDDEIREAFEQGGTKKYDHALKVHRRRIVENLRKKNVELGGLLEKYIEEQNDMADDDKLAIENGEYLLVFLTGGDHDKELKPVREWLQKAEKRDRELQTKRQEAGKSEKERAKIEAENQRIIEEVFRAAGYKPEFLARVRALGGIFAFNNMSRAMTQAIIRIKAKKFISEQRRIFQCDIEIAEEVYDYILSKVKDLDKMGGRGIENKFSELIKDRLGAEFLATGQRSNTKVAIVLEDGKIKINIIPLGEPDLREIAPQQGEAGALLEHFHRQAVDLNDVYSAYNVSLAEVRELLAGERIVDRGAPLKFDPNQSMAISGIMKCLDSFKKTPMSQALRFLAQGLLDMGADEEYAKAAQAVAQGLVLMASKGLFDYILKIDFKNNQDSFDTLKARSEGNDANGAIGKIISNVMAAGAAKNSKFTWRAGEDGLHFQVSVPCKLTEREIKLFQLYLEKAVDDEQAAQRIFEEAKAQGLYPNLNLLRNFAKLRQLAGSSAEIGFFIAEGKVNFWLSSPFVKAKPEKATVEKAAAGKKQKTSASAFDASKKDDGAYIAEFISANAEDWDQLSPEQLLANPAAQAVSEGLFDYFSEDVMLAEADEVESYVMPSLGEIYKTSPALNE